MNLGMFEGFANVSGFDGMENGLNEGFANAGLVEITEQGFNEDMENGLNDDLAIASLNEGMEQDFHECLEQGWNGYLANASKNEGTAQGLNDFEINEMDFSFHCRPGKPPVRRSDRRDVLRGRSLGVAGARTTAAKSKTLFTGFGHFDDGSLCPACCDVSKGGGSACSGCGLCTLCTGCDCSDGEAYFLRGGGPPD
jgi:hypothetical protein